MIARVALVLFALCAAVSSRNTPALKATMPSLCDGKLYCFEKSNEYPEDLIENIIKELDPQIVEGGNEIGDRKGFEKLDDDCERQINLDPIYEIVDHNDTVRYVVQSDTTFLQKIRTESCVSPGRITGHKSRIFNSRELEEWPIYCHEKRIEYSFLVLSLDGNSFESVKVKGDLPVCCSCKVESEYK